MMSASEVLEPGFFVDPHPTYDRWRQTEPVRRVQLPNALEVYLVTRYAEARTLLADRRLSVDERRVARLFPESATVTGRHHQLAQRLVDLQLSEHMLHRDPPDHTRLRRFVSRVFTPRRLEELRPRVSELVELLLDRMAAQDVAEADLVEAFAFPLPIEVICELVGVSIEDRETFRRCSHLLFNATADVDEVAAGMDELAACIRSLVAAKQSSLDTDLLSALIAVREEGDRLSETELMSMVYLLLVAGHETTVNLVTNGTYLLLTNPDQYALLRADPDRVPTAVEEFLRFEGPVVNSVYRFATEPIEVAGVTIPAGSAVMICLSSANRDADQFEAADRCDVSRERGPHLAFGYGAHFCLGASLARLEADVAFRALVTRFPQLQLAVPPDEITWRPSFLQRGLVGLPVRW